MTRFVVSSMRMAPERDREMLDEIGIVWEKNGVGEAHRVLGLMRRHGYCSGIANGGTYYMFEMALVSILKREFPGEDVPFMLSTPPGQEELLRRLGMRVTSGRLGI